MFHAIIDLDNYQPFMVKPSNQYDCNAWNALLNEWYIILYLGSGALPGKMLLVRIIENNKIYAYFTSG